MTNRRTPPEVNAGSMADIAFLLLIFFLVTASIEVDAGFNRMLPKIEPTEPIEINERNLFEINMNARHELLVEGELFDLKSLRKAVVQFIDNGGIKANSEGYCEYCKGSRDPKSSDNPENAIVSITTNRNTAYDLYVAVQNEVVGAYNDLRNREAQRNYGINYTEMVTVFNEKDLNPKQKSDLKNQFEFLRDLYPQKIIEAQITNQLDKKQ